MQLLLQKCTCGEEFNVSHALVCRHGGFQIHRHNRVRDLVASLLTEVCPSMTTEPELQPLSGERLGPSANKDDKARLDVRASDFWGMNYQDAFLIYGFFTPSLRRIITQSCRLFTANMKTKSVPSMGEESGR